MTFDVKFDWKEFNVDMGAVDAWAKANLHSYCGVSANDKLVLHFTAEPSDDDKAAFELYWEAIAHDSAEAEAYKSSDEREADKQSKKASAKAKLLVLGLSEDEVAAILG